MDEHSSVRPVQDTRRPAYGGGRVLVGVFAVFGAIVLVPSLVSLLRSPDERPRCGPSTFWEAVCTSSWPCVSLITGAGCATSAGCAWGALATMAVLIGVLTMTVPSPTPADLNASVWAHWGRSRWYLPAILPVVAAAWMWMSDPRRIVANAERITELSDTLTESITEKARAVQEGRAHKTSRGGRGR